MDRILVQVVAYVNLQDLLNLRLLNKLCRNILLINPFIVSFICNDKYFNNIIIDLQGYYIEDITNTNYLYNGVKIVQKDIINKMSIYDIKTQNDIYSYKYEVLIPSKLEICKLSSRNDLLSQYINSLSSSCIAFYNIVKYIINTNVNIHIKLIHRPQFILKNNKKLYNIFKQDTCTNIIKPRQRMTSTNSRAILNRVIKK